MKGGLVVKACAVCTLLFAVGCSRAFEHDPTPPDGYRAVVESDHDPEIRKHYPNPGLAEGDFDGDGKQDSAHLWVRTGGTGWQVIAYLSSQRDPVQVLESDRLPWRYVLYTYEAGEHKTARYYGIGPGGPDTTAIVHLSHEALAVGPWESESTMFLWDPEVREFSHVWMN